MTNRTLSAFLILGILGAVDVQGAEFSRRGFDTTDVIELSGPIEQGDLERLRELAAPRRQKSGPVVVIALNSRGGEIAEADAIAQYVARSGWDVAVTTRNVCASACFLILASGRRKFVHEDAYVGIHGAANSKGQQDQGALAATTFMARSFKRLGVPENLVGRMVTTPPDKMAWLSANDLLPMKVEIILREDARLSSIRN